MIREVKQASDQSVGRPVGDPEHELLFNRALIDTLLAALPIGIIVTNASGRFLHFNKAAEQLWGGRTAVSGIADFGQYVGFQPGSDTRMPPEEWNLARALLNGESSKDQAIEIRAFNGSRRAITSSASPFFTREGTLCGAVCVVADMVERARYEEALIFADRMASLGAMASGIAHEINNPLAAITTIAEFVQGLHCVPEEQPLLTEAANDLIAEAHRCGDIVKGLVQYTRNESPEKWLTSLNEVIVKSLAICRAQAAEHAVRIISDLNPVVPEILVNPVQMEQVAVTLIRNAIEAACCSGSAERRTPQVVIKSFLKGTNSCGFSVEDSGPGLTENERKRIFDPTFQSASRENAFISRGLSVCHEIMSDHGGKIRASTSPLGGTAIEVTVPLAVQH